LVQARNTIRKSSENSKTQGLSREVIKTMEESVEVAFYENETQAKRSINRLKADLKSLEQGLSRLEGGGRSVEDMVGFDLSRRETANT
jgi:hypothetical protein